MSNIRTNLQQELDSAVSLAKNNSSGRTADYIPQLMNVNQESTVACVKLCDGSIVESGDIDAKFTLQSVSKLILLIGMLEEYGVDQVFSWVNAEPSGQSFSAIGHLDRHGPVPANPLINPGAICLASHIDGDLDAKLQWVENWIIKIFGEKLGFCEDVFLSELDSADRNRALAYLMKSTGLLAGNVEDVLRPYFALCSYELTAAQAAHLPYLLANAGRDVLNNKQIFSKHTAAEVVSVMATCGLYDESGTHLLRTGMPSKTGVSGLIVSVVPGIAGVAAYSPKINTRGTSLRANIIMHELAKKMEWHFATSFLLFNKN